jgi:hypothetical protein
VAQGCFHPATKVQNASVHFFLGSEEVDDEDEEQEVCVLLCFVLTTKSPSRPSMSNPCIIDEK